MSAAGDIDPSATPPWSRSGFSNAFKRKGRKKTGSDTTSIASSGTLEKRSSLDKAMDRVTSAVEGRRSSTDSSTRKLSTILSSKRRTRKGNNSNSNVDSGSGSEPLSRTTTGEDDGGPSSGLQGLYSSSNEGPLAIEDSSNFTEDSDTEARPGTRPSLSPHQSHAGYLTLSSPLINAETVAPTAPSISSTDNLPSLGSSSTVPTKSDTLKPRSSPAQRRSPSPVGRLKEAFKPSRKGSTITPPVESESTKAQGDGGGALGGLSGGRGRKGSTSSRASPGPRLLEDQPIFQEPGEKTPSPRNAFTPRPIITAEPATPPGTKGPATVVTPPTPTDTHHQRIPSTPTVPEKAAYSNDTVDKGNTSGSDSASSRSQGGTHRRMRSATNGPSKLSNATSVPLTPAPEEVKTPGGTLTAPQAAGGFFSSMFSAAQNAANSLSNTITSNTSTQRVRSGTGPDKDSANPGESGGEEVILAAGSERQSEPQPGEKRQLAVETLGSGNLSLSHLGISDSSDPSPMTSKVDLGTPGFRNDEISAKAENDAAARAVSMAYSNGPNGDKAPSITPSIADTVRTGEDQAGTPIRANAEPESSSIRRAGSVRSRLSGRRRRTRGSSAATGTTAAPTIAGPGGTTAQRLTGFAVANPKRNKDFHNMFRSVPEDDYLIEDYVAALQREILLQGRLYISEGHICFSSNILGWITNLVISFDEVISVEKKSTAVIFQNAIVIQTLQARNVFASLLNRDTTYDLIISIWKISHPNLRSSLNGAPIEGTGTGDKTEKAGSVVDDASLSEEVYDEDEEEDDEEGDGSFIEANEGSTAPSEAGEAVKAVVRKASAMAVGPPANGSANKLADVVESVLTGAVAALDFPGPAAHEPTECGDAPSHHEKVLIDTTIPAPLGKVYSMMFGPASGAFMRKWLVEDQKSMDLQLEDDKKGLGADKKSMTFSYIKPLNGSIGPKQTKCIINQNLEQFDLDKAVTISCTTQNPDVPSGNIFVVKTRYCLMWAPGNSTRIINTSTIEWSGKSWLKGPIEKGANEGQLQYAKDIVAALRAAVTIKDKLKNASKGKSKAGRRKKEFTDATNVQQAGLDSSSAAGTKEPNWGLFEPLRGPLGPLASLFSPTVIIAILSSLVVLLWWRQSRLGPASYLGYPGIASPQRIAAYEEIWRGEEAELWKWLEERVGLDGATPAFLTKEQDRKDMLNKQRVMEMEQRLVSEEMNEIQMMDAIRITRERLEALEEAVRGRHKSSQSSQNTAKVTKAEEQPGVADAPLQGS